MKEKIQEAMRAAMKAGDKVRTSVLRMLLADIRYAELAGQEAMDAVVGYGKKLEKSIEEYRRLGKEDEAARLDAEHRIVGEFLPRRMGDEELAALVDRTIAEEKLASVKDLGRGMKKIMGEHGAEVDGRKVQELLKRKLGG